MTVTLSFLLSLSLHLFFGHCMTSAGRSGHGLIGYGISMYQPPCAFSCRAAISTSPLNCTMEAMAMPGMSMDMGSGDTEPECYATDDAFLQTLAWCMSTRRKDVHEWRLERYWKANVAGTASIQPDPKETYGQALAETVEAPTETLVSGDPLNKTSLVSETDYVSNWNALVAFEMSEDTHERYGLVLLLSGFIIPIGISLLRFIPFPAHLSTRFNAYFIDPPVFGSRHSVPAFFGLGLVPTRGQALFIAYLLILNIVLGAVGHRSTRPNAWFSDASSGEILTYATNRMGVLSFANVPLLILYAGRNNILLWVTNWSHSTFLLLHRWVAYICTLEAVLHSAIYLQIYVKDGEHASESKLTYWIWGAIATLSMSILVPTSILPLRQKMYELFLVWHIILSILAVAGCYLHILYRFQHQWGYEVWIITAFAVWGFERLMRLGRLARNGVKTATVTLIDDDYIRVNIEGVSGNGHAYLYFPTLTWRVWENHPFSVASTILPTPTQQNRHHDIEKNGAMTRFSDSHSSDIDSQVSGVQPSPKVGLTFLLRTRGGLTSQIRSKLSLPVLVESPYGPHPDLSSHPTLICIAGGVGITAVIPFLRSHPGRTKLFWGVRSSGIVEDMQSYLKGVDKEVFVGDRMAVSEVLGREFGDGVDNAVVVVSGPPGLADAVRLEVTKLGRRKGRGSIRLLEESFSW